MSEKTRRACYDALHRISKWRTFFAKWQLGTQKQNDSEFAAIRDHREVTMLLRIEMNAFSRLLLKKGMISQEEFEETITNEAILLDRDYAQRFPGAEDILALDQSAGKKDWLL